MTRELWKVVSAAKADDPRLLPSAALLPFLTPKMTAGTRSAWPSRMPWSGSMPCSSVPGPTCYGPFADPDSVARLDLQGYSTSRVGTEPRHQRALRLRRRQSSLIANLLMAADPKAYPRLFPLVQEQRAETYPCSKRKSPEGGIPQRGKRTGAVKDRACEAPSSGGGGSFARARPRRSSRRLVHRPDPRFRSFIVNWLNPLGAEPHVVVAELERKCSEQLTRHPAGPAGSRRAPPFQRPEASPTARRNRQRIDAILFDPDGFDAGRADSGRGNLREGEVLSPAS